MTTRRHFLPGRGEPQLLVSVSTALEARAAMSGGADIVDVKDPSQGPLGAPTLSACRSVQAAVSGRRQLSVALGELGDPQTRRRAEAICGVRFAKLALAGMLGRPWPAALRRVFQSLPHGIAPIVAAYADHQAARSPSPRAVLDAAPACGAQGLLIDTFDKSGGGLLDHLDIARLRELIDRARRHQLLIVLAGSLQGRMIDDVAALQPDSIGVRGAVCRSGRASPVEAELVSRIAARLKGPCQAPSRLAD